MTLTAAQTTFFPHQQRGIRAATVGLLRYGGYYLQHDPGMGKTREAIAVAQVLDCKRVVVVTTKAGRSVWPAELERWWPEGVSRVSVTNYDQLNDRMVDWLSQPIDLLILDESHYVKNYRSLRSKAVAKLRKFAAKVLLLSGTPAHSPLDYWNQYRLIAPHERPWCLNYVQYRDMIARLGGPHRNWIQGFKRAAVDDVEQQMARYTDKAVIGELRLPSPIETVYPVSLGERERVAYRRMAQALHYELDDGSVADAPIILTKILRLQQITAGFLRSTDGTDHTLGHSKIEAVMDILEERAAQKIVVAYRFAWEAKELQAHLKDVERPCAVIDGSVSTAERTRIIDSFQKGAEPTVLLLQEDAGGTSITLTAAAAMIFTTLPSSVIGFEQVKARIHRIGTVTSKQYIFLQATDSIDKTLLDGLRAKADLVSLVSLLRRSL